MSDWLSFLSSKAILSGELRSFEFNPSPMTLGCNGRRLNGIVISTVTIDTSVTLFYGASVIAFKCGKPVLMAFITCFIAFKWSAMFLFFESGDRQCNIWNIMETYDHLIETVGRVRRWNHCRVWTEKEKWGGHTK